MTTGDYAFDVACYFVVIVIFLNRGLVQKGSETVFFFSALPAALLARFARKKKIIIIITSGTQGRLWPETC